MGPSTSESREGRPHALQRELVLVVPALAVLGIGVAVVLNNGGFPPTSWYPASLLVLALAVVVGLAAGRPPGGRWGPAIPVLLALAMFGAWSYLSITWAVIPANAWDGSNRTLLYLLILGLLTLRAWPIHGVRWALGVFVSVLCALSIGLLIAMAAKQSPESFFQARRLAWPTGYANAAANLWLLGVPPALWLSCDPRLQWWARGLALGAAGLLVEVSLLSQSRGGVLALIVSVIVLLVLVPRRWPVLASVVVVAGAAVLTSGSVLGMVDATRATFGSDLYDARMAIVLVALALVIVGAVLALLVDRAAGRMPRSVARRGNLLMLGLAAMAVAASLAAMGNPGQWFDDRWQDFKNSEEATVKGSGGRLTGSLGSHRYDTYRVGLNVFLDNPVKGVGNDGYGVPYLLHRKTDESPHYAHSLIVSTLAELGAVGALLLLSFVAALMLVGRRALRRAGPGQRGPVAAALAGSAVYLVGSAVDWLWQFAGLGILGFGLLALALRSGDEEPDRADRFIPDRRQSRLVGAAVGVIALAATLSLALPSIAARFTDKAYQQSATNPTLAISRLGRAAHYNPLSAGPLLADGIIRRRGGDLKGAWHAFSDAAQREPNNWFAFFERAMISTLSGNWRSALSDAARADALNPRQPVIGEVTAAARRRRAVDPESLEAELTAQLTRRLDPIGED